MQSRKRSFYEAGANIFVGFVLSILIQYPLYSAFGWDTTLTHNLVATSVFTAMSFVRSYAIRRAFNYGEK